ncbi:hypothetical protein HYH03_017941 [Edaphochlamys debaryana]|uniref:Uncharacterized protein n=1 Tax=Edaphochlamys debaryana TaxID=47281 RepID=A0A836BNU5_9CHLO|nr:hypothetical protein HYH03_017941 [Edaphochlamys debaryana]|eukprot:KAG2483207.1 hypothetical protein HYH03_017941 [Edaphochlamys debaryana]
MSHTCLSKAISSPLDDEGPRSSLLSMSGVDDLECTVRGGKPRRATLSGPATRDSWPLFVLDSVAALRSSEDSFTSPPLRTLSSTLPRAHPADASPGGAKGEACPQDEPLSDALLVPSFRRLKEPQTKDNGSGSSSCSSPIRGLVNSGPPADVGFLDEIASHRPPWRGLSSPPAAVGGGCGGAPLHPVLVEVVKELAAMRAEMGLGLGTGPMGSAPAVQPLAPSCAGSEVGASALVGGELRKLNMPLARKVVNCSSAFVARSASPRPPSFKAWCSNSSALAAWSAAVGEGEAEAGAGQPRPLARPTGGASLRLATPAELARMEAAACGAGGAASQAHAGAGGGRSGGGSGSSPRGRSRGSGRGLSRLANSSNGGGRVSAARGHQQSGAASAWSS